MSTGGVMGDVIYCRGAWYEYGRWWLELLLEVAVVCWVPTRWNRGEVLVSVVEERKHKKKDWGDEEGEDPVV